jgi:hypothetical protein
MLNSTLKQTELVINCEKPHEYGLRHPGISGNICTWMLRDFLRTQFPHFNIDEGIVSRENSRKWATSDDYSPQIDIMIYSNDPLVRLHNYVVVPKNKIICGIEVKKWLSTHEVSKPNFKVNNQLNKIKKFTEKPTYLVSYRISSDESTIKMKSTADETFLFSKNCKGYPDYYEKLNKIIIKGELKRLVETISSLIITR